MRERTFSSLDIFETYALAEQTAERLSLELPPLSEFYWQYHSPVPLPLVRANRNGTLYLDRYYIAADTTGVPAYIYLTKHHISEEIYSYACASQTRGIKAELPPSISMQFTIALMEMNNDIWIREGISHPFTRWLPARRLKTALPPLAPGR